MARRKSREREDLGGRDVYVMGLVILSRAVKFCDSSLRGQWVMSEIGRLTRCALPENAAPITPDGAPKWAWVFALVRLSCVKPRSVVVYTVPVLLHAPGCAVTKAHSTPYPNNNTRR